MQIYNNLSKNIVLFHTHFYIKNRHRHNTINGDIGTSSGNTYFTIYYKFYFINLDYCKY